jgi:hypothetical protein
MRRIVAIVMLSVLMFNMGGYFILYSLLDKQAESLMNGRIMDGGISNDERVEFKVAFEMPYPVYDQRRELELPARLKSSSETYSFTSHEYTGGTLTLVGVRDQWAIHVDAVMSAYNKAANGDSSDSSLLHGLTSLFQFFIADDVISLVSKNSWQRLLQPVDYRQYFATVTLPSDPRPPRA